MKMKKREREDQVFFFSPPNDRETSISMAIDCALVPAQKTRATQASLYIQNDAHI